jgi:NAD(P)-dependent dehydrogenase (short-subunit alcohol dehydrogenase family)
MMKARLDDLGMMTDRWVVVTGGAGFLGRVIADAVLQRGANVVLVDRDRSSLNAAAEGLSSVARGLIEMELVDLESIEAREESARAILDRHSVDVLVNNAGFVGDTQLAGWAVPFESQSVETWRRALEINLTAPFHLSQLFGQSLARRGAGSIINISSIYGMLGPNLTLYDGTSMGNPAAYAASKGGLIQLTRWLATTLAPAVRVNAISPGGIARNQPESFVSKYQALTPMGRMGTETDFIGVIAYLASDLSAWVTGQNFAIDGGWSAW